MMFSSRFNELTSAIDSCVFLDSKGLIDEKVALETAFRMIHETSQRKGIVYVIGNGGSAGIASHFSNDLMKALKIASQTLYDTNILTCLANDIGYENAFSYMLERLLKPQDLLVAISSSGSSPNIINAVSVAVRRTVPVITLSGFKKENPLKKLGQLNFWIDRCDYGLVEGGHFFLLHTVIDLWNQRQPSVTYASINNPIYAKQD